MWCIHGCFILLKSTIHDNDICKERGGGERDRARERAKEKELELLFDVYMCTIHMSSCTNYGLDMDLVITVATAIIDELIMRTTAEIICEADTRDGGALQNKFI